MELTEEQVQDLSTGEDRVREGLSRLPEPGSVPNKPRRASGWKAAGVGLLVALCSWAAATLFVRPLAESYERSLTHSATFSGGEQWVFLALVLAVPIFSAGLMVLLFVIAIPVFHVARQGRFQPPLVTMAFMLGYTLVWFLLMPPPPGIVLGYSFSQLVPVCVGILVMLRWSNESRPQ